MYSADIYSYYLLCARSQGVTKFIVNDLSLEAYGMVSRDHTRFVQKVSGLTTVHEVDKAYGVLTLIVFLSST